MKKIVSIILLLILISLPFTVLATDDPNTETPTEETTANLSFVITSADTEKMVVQINLGEFEGVPSPAVMSASFTLGYNAEHIQRIEGQSSEGWDITIAEESNRVMLESDTANPNTTIAEIIFYFNEISEVTTGSINISEINISDGDQYDEYPQDTSLAYTIEPVTEEPDPNVNEIIPDQNIVIDTGTDEDEQGTNETTGTPITNPDNTMAPDKELPQTGISTAIVVLITIVLVLAVIGIIRYKQIEIK